VVTLDGGFTFYHAGDTAVFSDMALLAELYRPQLALLPIGDRFVMSPREAARAVGFLQGIEAVVPMHFGTFPQLSGTPAAFRAALAESAAAASGAAAQPVEVIELQPGETRSA
jgi:L-ascorbate metabolism protein UlaG (beta-lactamase superfamily)